LAKVSFVVLPKRAFKFRAFTILQTLNWRMVYNKIYYCMFIINQFDLKVSCQNCLKKPWKCVLKIINGHNYESIWRVIILLTIQAIINNPYITSIFFFMAIFIHPPSNLFYTMVVH
jgi:hypothetical protein